MLRVQHVVLDVAKLFIRHFVGVKVETPLALRVEYTIQQMLLVVNS